MDATNWNSRPHSKGNTCVFNILTRSRCGTCVELFFEWLIGVRHFVQITGRAFVLWATTSGSFGVTRARRSGTALKNWLPTSLLPPPSIIRHRWPGECECSSWRLNKKCYLRHNSMEVQIVRLHAIRYL